MQRTALPLAACLLLACGAPHESNPVSGSHASSALTPDAVESGTGSTAHDRDSVRATSAAVSVCHRAGERWVPLRLPEAAVESHVSNHGDFVYDASAGQCCTDADCAAGLSCRHAVGLDGETLIGTCPIAGVGGMSTDPKGLLLAMGLFGAVGGTTSPFDGILRRDAADHYFLSFTLNGINAQVALAHFVPGETTLAESSSTPVTVAFPARNAGLITFDADGGPASQRSYLNLNFPLTESSLLGTGTVDLINATVANFTLDITGDPETYPVVFLDSGGSYTILGIRAVYVQPISYIGDGSGNAGFYPGLLNSTITANILVFREAVYDVRL